MRQGLGPWIPFLEHSAWLKRRLTPQPLNCYQEPIRLNHPLGNGVQKTYIACTDPPYEPLVPTHHWVRRQKGWQYLEFGPWRDGDPTEALAELLLGCSSSIETERERHALGSDRTIF